MTLLFLLLDAIAAVVVTLAACVQILYLESLRLRTREFPSLQFFKETLEARLGMETEVGALTFSLIKHIGLAIIGCLTLALFAQNTDGGEALIVAILISGLYAVLGTYVVPQILYRKASGRGLLPLVPVYRGMAVAMRPRSCAGSIL